MGRDNWFLVVPALVLGLVALWTVHSMYRAGDIRRAIEVVLTYQAHGQPPLREYLSECEGSVSCTAQVRSSFYGTLDVSCRGERSPQPYNWRVHVGQRAFAPSDEPTRALMKAYAPEIFGAGEQE